MVKRWKGHGGVINAVAFNEESSIALSAGQDGLVYCYGNRAFGFFGEKRPLSFIDVRSRGPPIQVKSFNSYLFA